MQNETNNVTVNRKSHYNPNRGCYLTADGRYAYVVWDEETKCNVTQYIEVGKNGVTEEMVIFLDQEDHDWDLSERYKEEHSDYVFTNQQQQHSVNGVEYSDPIEAIADGCADIMEILYPGEEGPNELLNQLTQILDTLTENQRNLFYDHIGSMRQLEDIRRAEIAATGKEVTQQAISNRWKKIITRICKEFGVPVPQKRKSIDK